jgi:ferredoxin/flavodoxin---NADP+ reductase
MSFRPGHLVCIFGGGIAGSEAAAKFSERGIHSVVFDMGVLPWGKIELGLPKWHSKQRDQEEAGIDEKMADPHVWYVPSTKLGRDVTLDEVLGWGPSAVLLAVGAWRDRPLAVPAIEDYEGRGFYYQNPFVSWFNQYHSPDYTAPQCEIHDDAVVVGGGLASLDVVKILMFETTQRALLERGLEADLFHLEKKGIPKVIQSLGVSWESLGLKGCTLYYRRRAQDMPLIPLDDDVTPERAAQAEKVRVKLLENFRAKYLFRFEPCCIPVDMRVEGDRLSGLVFRRTEVVDGKVRPLPGTEFSVSTPLVVSSIGSVPEPIPGVPMNGELFRLKDWKTGQVEGFENVFALGNAVTGRGNIRASRVHGREISDWIIDEFLRERKPLRPERIARIREQVRRLQHRVGFDSDYRSWVDRHLPVRLESLSLS